MKAALTIQIRVGEHDGPVSLHGRDAWAVRQLLAAGERGCTPIEQPGPRWSAYVHKLRRLGLVIETVHERHAGPFPGRHARYELRSRLTVVGSNEQEAA